MEKQLVERRAAHRPYIGVLSGACEISHKRLYERTHGGRSWKGSSGMALHPAQSEHYFANRRHLPTFMVAYYYTESYMTQAMTSIVIFTKIVAKTYFEKRES